MGRSDKRKHQNEDAFIAKQANHCETAGAACHEEVHMPMAGSMDELDNRIMALRWQYESRERRRDFVYFILEKRCSQQ